MKEIQIRAECDQTVAKELQKAMRDTFSLRIPVESTPENTLPRFEMKAKRWLEQEK